MAKEKTCFLSRHFLYFPRIHSIRSAAVSRQPVTKDGELCDNNNLPENETLIAKFAMFRSWTNPEEAQPEEIAPDDEVMEYAKEHGILLTEISREVVVKVAEETEE